MFDDRRDFYVMPWMVSNCWTSLARSWSSISADPGLEVVVGWSMMMPATYCPSPQYPIYLAFPNRAKGGPGINDR